MGHLVAHYFELIVALRLFVPFLFVPFLFVLRLKGPLDEPPGHLQLQMESLLLRELPGVDTSAQWPDQR